MARHLIGIVALSLFVVGCRFLPFLPGGYDRLAAPLSIMAEAFGYAGLILVPIGGAWSLSELRSRRAAAFYFAVASLVAASLVAAIVFLAAATTFGRSFGLGGLVLWALCGVKFVPMIWRLRSAKEGPGIAAPLYLVVVPLVVAAIQFSLVGHAVRFSRQRAIENSSRLIHDIEEYQRANGRYPVSLLALWQDYRPGIAGIERYYYEPNNDGYDLFFEQLSDRFGTREIVMYNTRDEHSLPSHDSDLLFWTPEQQRARPGHYALHHASTPGWKYFWFD